MRRKDFGETATKEGHKVFFRGNEDTHEHGVGFLVHKDICGPFCSDNTNERELRLLEFATFNDRVLANTFGHHKASRRWTWHGPN